MDVYKTKKQKVTLKDIAEATGFSVNTVSRVLADKDDISTKTKAMIREKIAELGYIANASASFLRSGVSRVISIIIGDISNPHFSVMVKEMQTLLQKKGYICIIFNTEENHSLELQAITTSISHNVDGVIICPTSMGHKNIQLLYKHRIPFVMIGRRFGKSNDLYVICDDENGGYMATKYLLEKGHRNILFLDGPKGISSSEDRLQGFRRALDEAGLIPKIEQVQTVPLTAEKAKMVIPKIFEKLRNCNYTAVLCFSDIIAWQLICYLEQKNIKVPEQCSVIGFDNVKFNYPLQLTSVSSSKTTMAKKAVGLILQELTERKIPQNSIVLETHLVEGGTVAKPPCGADENINKE